MSCGQSEALLLRRQTQTVSEADVHLLPKPSFAKFMSEEELKALASAMEGEPGDLLFFAADKNKIVFLALQPVLLH